MSDGLSLVGQWNEVMLDAIRSEGASPTPTSYHLHLTSSAVYDAWAAYDAAAYGAYTDIVRPLEEHTEANKAIAVSYAFYDMLSLFFPGQQTKFDAFMAQLGHDPAASGNGASDPITVARTAAQGVLSARSDDGSNFANDFADTSGYVPTNDPQEGSAGAPGGDQFDPNAWQPLQVPNGTLLDNNGNPTYDDNDPTTFDDQVALTPHWGDVEGFALETGDQVRPPAPPLLGDTSEYIDALGNVTTNDQAYRDQFTAVMTASANLTTEQKVIAEYWADGPRTEAPPGHWNQIAQDISLREGHGIDDDAKMFFALNAALFDASIATWEAKYHYNYVRPQSAIRDLYYDQEIQSWAGPDLGTQTIMGQDWQPYQDTTFVTPPFPEYTSGHSSFSFAAARAIAAYVGSDAFYDGTTLSNYDLDDVDGTDLLGQYVATELLFETFTGPPVVLQWATLTEAAAEAGDSRIYGGIHIQDGDYNGRQIGEDVAALGQVKWQSLFSRAGDDGIVGTDVAELILAGTGADTVAAGAGDDTISGGAGSDNLAGGAGADDFRDALQDLLGDTITDFEAGLDRIVIQNSLIERQDLIVGDGNGTIGVDTDNSGSVNNDEQINLSGGLSNGTFMAVTGESDTIVTFETFLPALQDLQQVDAAAVNGMINDAFFQGDGITSFRVTLNANAVAEFDNALGVYEVDAAGDIVDAHLLFDSTKAQNGPLALSQVEDGNKLGFFLVQDGADWATGLSDSDVLSFVNAEGEAANVSDVAQVQMAVNGRVTDETVFHSFDKALNADGIEHALSGVNADGTAVLVGFEDLLGGGDLDYQDVLFTVENADVFIM